MENEGREEGRKEAWPSRAVLFRAPHTEDVPLFGLILTAGAEPLLPHVQSCTKWPRQGTGKETGICIWGLCSIQHSPEESNEASSPGGSAFGDRWQAILLLQQ